MNWGVEKRGHEYYYRSRRRGSWCRIARTNLDFSQCVSGLTRMKRVSEPDGVVGCRKIGIGDITPVSKGREVQWLVVGSLFC